jgi:hypothetical protein
MKSAISLPPTPPSVNMPPTSFRLRDNKVAWRRAGDEAVVLDLNRSNYHALNAAGTLLWERLREWATAEQLAGLLVECFGITPEEAAGDVVHFLTECIDVGLLQAAPDR